MGREKATGALERVDVADERPTGWDEYEHRARYAWADSILGSGAVLDVACGTGHGAELLGRDGTRDVIGLDRDPGSIERASSRSPGRFLVADVPPFPLDESSFDAVVSFETIEHIEDDDGFIAEAARVLKPDGVLLISTPNKEVTSPSGLPENEFHVREYLRQEFEGLLRQGGFAVAEVLAQRDEAGGALRRRLRGLAYRARSMAARSRWAHTLVFARILDMDVHPLRRGERPAFWIVRARREP